MRVAPFKVPFLKFNLPPGMTTVMSTIIVGLVGYVLTLVSAEAFELYGWVLFFLLPVALGWLSVWMDTRSEYRSMARCQTVGLLSIGWAAIFMLVFAAEGGICMLMCAPIWGLAVMTGAGIGHACQPYSQRLMPLILLALPLLMGAEAEWPMPLPEHKVISSVIIDADAETVWKHVVTFSDLPEPTDWVFSTGVAYPIRASIEGSGVGAVRYCEFSTGDFVEPITVWDEPRLLRFDVTENPPPMQEWSFHDHVDPPHLHGHLQSKMGQFKLTTLPDGRTLLEGTTWYTHRIWPQAYWRVWSDYIIHRIHRRVLNHIKQLAEAELPPG